MPIKPKALKFQKISKSYSKYLKEGLNTSTSTTAIADLTKNGPNQEIVQAKVNINFNCSLFSIKILITI